MTREGDHYTIELPEGESVNRCYIDFQFTMQLLGCQLLVVVEGPFVLRTGTSTIVVDPEIPESIGPALSVVRRKVESIKAYDRGMLEVTFDHDLAITVEPLELFEAWNIAGNGGPMLVCMPGGKLAVWS